MLCLQIDPPSCEARRACACGMQGVTEAQLGSSSIAASGSLAGVPAGLTKVSSLSGREQHQEMRGTTADHYSMTYMSR